MNFYAILEPLQTTEWLHKSCVGHIHSGWIRFLPPRWSLWQQLRVFYCCKGLIGCVPPPSGKPQYVLMFEVWPELRVRGAKTYFPQRKGFSVIVFLCSKWKCPPLSIPNCCYLVFSSPPILTLSLYRFLVSCAYLAAGVAADSPVTILHAAWPLGQGEIPLAKWLACMSNHPGVSGLKPTWALCASPHQYLL